MVGDLQLAEGHRQRHPSFPADFQAERNGLAQVGDSLLLSGALTHAARDLRTLGYDATINLIRSEHDVEFHRVFLSPPTDAGEG
jgi:hypothetical protein